MKTRWRTQENEKGLRWKRMRLKKQAFAKRHCVSRFLRVSIHLFHFQVFLVLLFFEEFFLFLFNLSLLTSYINLLHCLYLLLVSCLVSSILCVCLYVCVFHTFLFSSLLFVFSLQLCVCLCVSHISSFFLVLCLIF